MKWQWESEICGLEFLSKRGKIIIAIVTIVLGILLSIWVCASSTVNGICP